MPTPTSKSATAPKRKKTVKVTKPMTAPKANKTTRYFSTSPAKLFLLTFLTFGLYDVYWFYRNWKAIRDDKKEFLSPFWRSIFAIFFVEALFKRIGESAQQKNYTQKFSAARLAALYIFSAFIEYIVIRVAEYSTTSYTVTIALGGAVMLLLIGRISSLVIAQKAINFYLADTKQYAKPSSTGPGSMAVAVIGFAYFCLVVLGLFAPDSASVTDASLKRQSPISATGKVLGAQTTDPADANKAQSAPAGPAASSAPTASAPTSVAKSAGTSSPAAPAPNQQPTSAAATSNANWSTYNNQTYGFSLQYPAGGAWPYNWTYFEQSLTPQGDFPQEATVTFTADNGQRYPETVRIEIHAGNLASGASYYDKYYAQNAAISASKSTTTVNGKAAVLYNETSSGEQTKFYLVGAGDKTLVISSVHGNLNQGKFGDYWSVFDRVVNSLVVR